MFKLAVNPSILVAVRVELPGDNGKPIINTFKAQFKRVSQSELDDIYERLNPSSKAGADALDASDDAPKFTDSALLEEVMVGWEDVFDANGNALPFNSDNFAALLDVHPVRPTLVKAFFAAINGAKAKN